MYYTGTEIAVQSATDNRERIKPTQGIQKYHGSSSIAAIDDINSPLFLAVRLKSVEAVHPIPACLPPYLLASYAAGRNTHSQLRRRTHEDGLLLLLLDGSQLFTGRRHRRQLLRRLLRSKVSSSVRPARRWVGVTSCSSGRRAARARPPRRIHGVFKLGGLHFPAHRRASTTTTATSPCCCAAWSSGRQ